MLIYKYDLISIINSWGSSKKKKYSQVGHIAKNKPLFELKGENNFGANYCNKKCHSSNYGSYKNNSGLHFTR